MPSDFDAVTDDALAYLRLHGRNTDGYLKGKSVAERFALALRGRRAGGDRRPCAGAGGAGGGGPRGLQQQPGRRRPYGGPALPRAAGPGAGGRGAAAALAAAQLEPDLGDVAVPGSRPNGPRAARPGTGPSRCRRCRARRRRWGRTPGPRRSPRSAPPCEPTSTLRTTVSDCACLTLFDTSSVTSRRSVSISGGSMSARSVDSARRARAAASGPPRRRRLMPSSTLEVLELTEPPKGGPTMRVCVAMRVLPIRVRFSCRPR